MAVSETSDGTTRPVAKSPFDSGVGMVYLAMSPWEDMWRSRHQLMSRFSRMMPVMYVEPHQSLKKLRRTPFSLQGIIDECRTPLVSGGIEGPHVFRTSGRLPVSGSRKLGDITRRSWLRALNRHLKTIGIHKPIVWISRPEMHWVLGQLGEIFSIYHAVDEYAGYSMMDEDRRRQLRVIEDQVLDQVDLTITVSPELVVSKSGDDRDIQVVENAVDIDLFASALEDTTGHPDLVGIPGPRIGYSGLISQRLDLDLLIELAETRPDWSLVLVGSVDDRKCEGEIARLMEQGNVHFIGRRKVEEVPRLIAGVDVCLLPYAMNIESTYLSPLKLYEYLACGKPVVSTPVPAALRKKEIVSIGSRATDFVELIEKAVGDRSDVSRNARLAEAARNTWDNRIAEITKLIRERLP